MPDSDSFDTPFVLYPTDDQISVQNPYSHLWETKNIHVILFCEFSICLKENREMNTNLINKEKIKIQVNPDGNSIKLETINKDGMTLSSFVDLIDQIGITPTDITSIIGIGPGLQLPVNLTDLCREKFQNKHDCLHQSRSI